VAHNRVAPNTSLATFCRTVKMRSAENREAMSRLVAGALFGNAIGVLRQELDSLIRVMYLLNVGDKTYRQKLIDDTVAGRRWRRRDSKAYITDREMVEAANRMHGWSKSVYRFGCAFIHLSKLHDYHTKDPFIALPEEERTQILDHLRRYHGGLHGEHPTFADVVPYLPRVLDKISSNLEVYVSDLLKQKNLDT
jgi:hypothetical protein